MGFREELEPYFDEDGLVGTKPNPEKWSGGNQLLDTGIAYTFLKKIYGATHDDSERFSRAVGSCEVKPGLYNKNPGRTDQITHDCIIGIVAGSYFQNTLSDFDVANYGLRNGWKFSNTGEDYYTAYAKPWHIAFYLYAAGMKPSLWDKLSLFIAILTNAYTRLDDASGKRLMWLITRVVNGKSNLIDLAIAVWEMRIQKVYGGMKRVFTMYHGEHHPFSKYAELLSQSD